MACQRLSDSSRGSLATERYFRKKEVDLFGKVRKEGLDVTAVQPQRQLNAFDVRGLVPCLTHENVSAEHTFSTSMSTAA